MTEEARARLYREQCAARARYRAGRFTALAANPAAATAAAEAWAPLLRQPTDAWDCPCDPEPARPAWASRVPAGIDLPNYLK